MSGARGRQRKKERRREARMMHDFSCRKCKVAATSMPTYGAAVTTTTAKHQHCHPRTMPTTDHDDCFHCRYCRAVATSPELGP